VKKSVVYLLRLVLYVLYNICVFFLTTFVLKAMAYLGVNDLHTYFLAGALIAVISLCGYDIYNSVTNSLIK